MWERIKYEIWWQKLRFKHRCIEQGDKLARKIAWLLPRSVVKWAFVRVYAFACQKYGPTEEYGLVATSWDLNTPLEFNLNTSAGGCDVDR